MAEEQKGSKFYTLSISLDGVCVWSIMAEKGGGIQASYLGVSAENNTTSIAGSGRADVGVGGEANEMGTADGGMVNSQSLEGR